jgi:hypothetical protein
VSSKVIPISKNTEADFFYHQTQQARRKAVATLTHTRLENIYLQEIKPQLNQSQNLVQGYAWIELEGYAFFEIEAIRKHVVKKGFRVAGIQSEGDNGYWDYACWAMRVSWNKIRRRNKNWQSRKNGNRLST